VSGGGQVVQAVVVSAGGDWQAHQNVAVAKAQLAR